MNDRRTAYLSPKLVSRPHPKKGDRGVFAIGPIAAGELLTVWGGDVLNAEQLSHVSERERAHTIQVEEGLYLTPHRPPEAADYVNHSCDPNAGLSGQIALVAMRDIVPGEEICLDYAMCDGSPYDEFDCACGTPSCRGRVTGDDWRNPILWKRYAGHFSPYLRRRIEALQRARARRPRRKRVLALAAGGTEAP